MWSTPAYSDALVLIISQNSGEVLQERCNFQGSMFATPYRETVIQQMLQQKLKTCVVPQLTKQTQSPTTRPTGMILSDELHKFTSEMYMQ
jgi:hypothetical protein